jgi:hypothetical protein
MDPRILYSLQAAILFFIIASPQLYKITGKIFKLKGIPLIILHAVVYGLIIYLLMRIQ